MKELINQGGFVMYPLIVLSVTSLAIIFERFFFWVKTNLKIKESVLYEILDLSEKKKFEKIKDKIANQDNYIIRILVSGLLHREFSPVEAMESASIDEIKKMNRFMNVLDTIITVSPLLGILGTVIGIISSFEILGSSGLSDPKAITVGIAQALITTASGLSIAIFTLFPYNFFNSRIENAERKIEKYATNLEISLKQKT